MTYIQRFLGILESGQAILTSCFDPGSFNIRWWGWSDNLSSLIKEIHMTSAPKDFSPRSTKFPAANDAFLAAGSTFPPSTSFLGI